MISVSRTLAAAALVSTLAIAGIPPFAGFFSKDEILSQAFQHDALIWALAVGAVGFYLGTNWALVQGLIRALGMGGLVVAAILILAALLLRRRASHI